MYTFLKSLFSQYFKTNPNAKHYNSFFRMMHGQRIYLVGEIKKFKKTASVSSTVGYLLDMDDQHYYLGDTPEYITHWVKRGPSNGELVPQETKSQKTSKPSNKDKYDTLLDELVTDDKLKVN